MPQSLPGWQAVGELSIHDRRARLHVDQRPGADSAAIAWRIAR